MKNSDLRIPKHDGWDEFEENGLEETKISAPCHPHGDPNHEPGWVDQSLLNQLATARSHREVCSAVGDELDDEEAEAYLRPDLEPLLSTLHRESATLTPPPHQHDVALEVVFAIGTSIEDAALLAPGDRYWWGGTPQRLLEPLVAASDRRFPMVNHTGHGNFRIQVPNTPDWKIFRKSQRKTRTHRSGTLKGLEAVRGEQIEVAFGAFTFYVRCVALPPRPQPAPHLRRARRSAAGAFALSVLLHLAIFALPLSGLRTVDHFNPANDRFVEFSIAPFVPNEAPTPTAHSTKTVHASEERTTKSRSPRRAAHAKEKPRTAPPRQAEPLSTANHPAAPSSTSSPKISVEMPSIRDFEVGGRIGRLPNMKRPSQAPNKEQETKRPRSQTSLFLSRIDKRASSSDRETQEIAQKHAAEVARCQAIALRATPALHGKLLLGWSISTQGRPNRIRVVYDDLGSSDFTECVRAAVQRWQFSKRQSETPVTFPFIVAHGRR